jgi:hypothetical protein
MYISGKLRIYQCKIPTVITLWRGGSTKRDHTIVWKDDRWLVWCCNVVCNSGGRVWGSPPETFFIFPLKQIFLYTAKL